MKKGELTIGKWHIKIGLIPAYWRSNGMFLHFGIFKMLKYPPQGHLITREHYRGFWFRKEWDFRGFEINLL